MQDQVFGSNRVATDRYFQSVEHAYVRNGSNCEIDGRLRATTADAGINDRRVGSCPKKTCLSQRRLLQ